MKQAKTQNTALCYHCGDPCTTSKVRSGEFSFCCEGCKLVYELLQQHGMCTYYDLNDMPGIGQRMEVRSDKFAFLDDPAICQQLIRFTDGRQTHVSFYLPQMHCSSCLWLLEHIGRLRAGIISSRVDFTHKEVLITFDAVSCSLRQVAETLTAIGYEPHINLADLKQDPAPAGYKEKLYRIGVAGFCFSNIMIMSLPEYFSTADVVEPAIAIVFRYLSVVLALPVLLYCADSFFITAWKGLRNRFLNIDLPVALAILITFGRSIYEIFSATGSGYLDSMSGIIFFMLLGRWLQDRTYQAISFDRDFRSFFPVAVETKREGIFVPVMIEELRPDDIIRVHHDELIPADAILSKGTAAIDYSFVSGESRPVQALVGEIVYAGGKQLGNVLELIVIKEVSQSYLTHLWNRSAGKEQRRQPSFIHGISRYFTLVVLLLAAAAAAYWGGKGAYQQMWNALTTVLIVACPCALLLSSTFTNGNILRILGRNQLYLRHPDVIEDLAATSHIVLDKTGTLTHARQQEVRYDGRQLSIEEQQLLGTIFTQSVHPLSQSIGRFLAREATDHMAEIKEWPGKGIEAWIDDRHVKVGSAVFVNGTESGPDIDPAAVVYARFDRELVGKFSVQHRYREGYETLLKGLDRKFHLSVLSGDNDAAAPHLRQILGPEAALHFRQQPEDKLVYIRKLQEEKQARVLMIGDGLNDAGALQQSNTGIALTEGPTHFTPASDGIMEASRLVQAGSFIAFAKSGKQVILASFVLSVLYNVIGLYFALQGTLSPVIAAILMPASSISIILLSYGMTSWMARRYHLS